MDQSDISGQRRFLMLMLLSRREQFYNMDDRQKRLFLLIIWYLKRQNQRNVMIRRQRRWWVRPINQHRNNQGDGENLINEMRLQDVESHFKYCRMTIDTFDELLAIVGPTIQRMQTNFREPISPRTRLYLTLR
jgi:hypothetical protein